MAGAWISAWAATSLSRVPAYPFRLSTCAAESRIRSLVRADLEPASPAAAASCFLGTRQIIGSAAFRATQPGLAVPRGARLRCNYLIQPRATLTLAEDCDYVPRLVRGRGPGPDRGGHGRHRRDAQLPPAPAALRPPGSRASRSRPAARARPS